VAVDPPALEDAAGGGAGAVLNGAVGGETHDAGRTGETTGRQAGAREP
jgi:hypothetical protein